MKTILILALAITLHANNTLLLSGFSYHSKPKDKAGERYETFNYGIGYSYSKDYYSVSGLAIIDSYGYPMFALTVAPQYKIDNFVVALELGYAYRSSKYTTNWSDATYKHEFLPTGGLRLTYKYDIYSVNIISAPSNFKGSDNVLVSYINFGIDF